MPYTATQIKQIIVDAARRYGISETIALNQIRQESGYNPNAVSSQGAQGLAQFMPGTWAQYGSGSPFDPLAAMDAWGRYMRHLLSKFNGDYRLALAGYHSGEGAAAAALRNCPGNPRTCHYVNTIAGGSSPAVFPSPVSPGTSAGGPATFNVAPIVIIGIVALLVMR